MNLKNYAKIIYKRLYTNSKNEKFIIYVVECHYWTICEYMIDPQIKIYKYDEELDKTDDVNRHFSITDFDESLLVKINYGQHEYALTLYEKENSLFSALKMSEIIKNLYTKFNIDFSKDIMKDVLRKYEELLVLCKLNNFKGGN